MFTRVALIPGCICCGILLVVENCLILRPLIKLVHVSLFFFFSSRRRHTRYWRDWSSDVCSSDLPAREGGLLRAGGRGGVDRGRLPRGARRAQGSGAQERGALRLPPAGDGGNPGRDRKSVV